MASAQCSCGSLSLELPESSELVIACHCIECQRRSGSPFGVGAYYPLASVTMSGSAREFVRDTASGQKFRSYFCPNCGSTVYWKADKLPAMIAVALGCLADPGYRGPDRSVFEQSKHHWVDIEVAGAHFQQGSIPNAAK